LICLIGSLSVASFAQDPFEENIRKTEALTPEQERKALHVPPGFEVQLVASEPAIGKPMNMAFDGRGRLWLTQSREYPFAAPVDKPGRDKIIILEDFDGAGHARKVTTFAEGLNIPIGLYPYKNGVIAFSIPNIYFFQDTDGDGKADKKELVLGRFGFDRDVHGLTSAFRRGYDGWIYADHGYNNNTTLAAKDGSTITMNSGNCYRFRPDGSRVEQYSWGQVNPFGLMFDPLGDLWSADCHSSPVYQLLRGAYYPSFGKPHDGLGFAPNVCEHSHGSTAIAGMVYYAAEEFPAEYRGNTFVGNVMTCRINRDSLVERGSTRMAKEEPDFLRSDDPWFRPVDLRLGPDGAVYVADFYNRIIGHYEVPLEHPGRDRERGRVWRIVHRGGVGAETSNFKLQTSEKLQTSKGEGKDGKSGTDVKGGEALMQQGKGEKGGRGREREGEGLGNDFSRMGVRELVEELGSANITRRMLAIDELSDRAGEGAVPAIRKMLLDKKSVPIQQAHGLWVLERLGKIDEELVANAAKDGERLVRVHAMRILGEMGKWTKRENDLAMAGLKDADPYVQRAAAEAVGRHPSTEHVAALIGLEVGLTPEGNFKLQTPNFKFQTSNDLARGGKTVETVKSDNAGSGTQLAGARPSENRLKPGHQTEDAQLLYVVRMALRNQLLPAENFAKVLDTPLGESASRAIADVSLGIPTTEAGRFLSRHIQRFAEPREKLSAYLRHIVRYAPEEELGRLAELTRAKFADDLDFQLALFKSILEGANQRGARLPEQVTSWGTDLAERLLVSVDVNTLDWRNSPVKGGDTTNPWFLENRTSADGDMSSLFISSLSPGGEKLTGILRSRTFTIPARLSFFMAGHDGSPDKPQLKRNFVRLRDAGTRQILAQSVPPRNDVAQPFSWDLAKHAEKQGYLEVVDGNGGHSYAWLAVGRFSPAVVPLPKVIPNQVDKRQLAAAELASTLRLKKLEPRLIELVTDHEADVEVRGAAAKAICGFETPNSKLQTSEKTKTTNEHESTRMNTLVLGRILGDGEEPMALRQKIAAALGEVKREEARKILLETLPNAAMGLQTAIGVALASTTQGAEALLEAAEAGKISARLLQERSVRDRIVAAKAANAADRIEKLTAALPALSGERQKIIDQRFAAFNPAEASAERGAAVFKQYCAVCHSIDGQGALIGPQLDGVGARGAERIIEDILDPNRNVDVAFRTTLLVMKDGDVQSGLFRREEGEVIVLAQGNGQEISVPKKDVQERRETGTSLMPDNFAEAIKEGEFKDLMGFLVSKRAK